MLEVTAAGSVVDTYCGLMASASNFTPENNCSSRVTECGSFTMVADSQNGNPGCFVSGAQVCTYQILPVNGLGTTLTLACDNNFAATYTAGAGYVPSSGEGTSEIFSFSATGPGGTNPTFTVPTAFTKNTLTVTVTAEPSLPISGTSFSPDYSHISYQVSIVETGETLVTDMLPIGQAQTLDFSSSVGTDLTAATITITPKASDYCSYLAGDPSACPLLAQWQAGGMATIVYGQ
jgi:hypothetical protein